MKSLLQILLFLLTWLTTFANATPPVQKPAIPNYAVSFSTTENQKLESEVIIRVEIPITFGIARIGISANYSELDDPELSKVLALTSGIVGVVDLGASVSSFKSLKTASNPRKSSLALLNKTESALQANHEQKVESLLDLIESGIDANLQAVYSNPKSKELFIELLEMEKLHAQKNNKFANVQRIEEGILRVQGAGSWLDDLDILLGSGTKTKVNNWINEGLNPSKLEVAFANTTDKASLFSKIDNAKSLQHQKVIVKDFNIPGVSSGPYISNSVDNVTQSLNKSIEGKSLTLKTYQAETFQKNASLPNRTDIEIIEDLGNGIQLIKVKPGTKLYRVYDGYQPGVNTLPKGNYWTFDKPSNLSEVIGGTAVQPEWNSMTKIIEIEVPNEGIYVWRGKAAKQPLSNNENITNYFLNGGSEQLIFDINQNGINLPSITINITNVPW